MEKDGICIYINNYGTKDISLPNLVKNNPGMGGTQYEMFLLCQLLKENGINFTLLLTHHQNFESRIDYVLVKDIVDAFQYCNKNYIGHLVLRANDGLDDLDQLGNTKIIYWIHNFIDYKSATKISKSDKVERVVFVSQEEADFYYDHDISKKGVVIFNAIPEISTLSKPSKKEKNVVFVGDISPYKMLDKVTQMWPKIIKKVPEAKLIVLGSGDLYGKGKVFGKYGIAEEKYENLVLRPLLKNNILESVIFKGLVKGNMDEQISTAKVSIFINPVETFCIAATDSIKNCVPAICPKSTGYCDVVTKSTGYLFKYKRNAIKKIIKILTDKKVYPMKENDLKYLDTFSSSKFINGWINLFNELPKKYPEKLSHKNNLTVNGKFFVILLRNIRKIFHLPNCFSRIGIKWHLKKLLGKN